MKHLIKIFSISLIALLAIVNCRHHSLADRADWIAKRVASEHDLNDKQKEELQRIKKEILEKQKELITAKTKAIQSGERIEELYNNALNAMKSYSSDTLHGDRNDENVY